MNSAELTIDQMNRSPEIMSELVSCAVTFLAGKHAAKGITEDHIMSAYVAGTPAVVKQVDQLVLIGWSAVHEKAS